MFSLLIMSHIVNYIIILLVLINFISDNFKIFWDAGWPTGPKFAHNSKNSAGETLRLPCCSYKNRGGGWPTCHFIFSLSHRALKLPVQPPSCPESSSAVAVP